VPEYDALVAEADSNPNWEERVKLYEQAEQVMIDQGLIVPLVHPVIMAVVSDTSRAPASRPTARASPRSIVSVTSSTRTSP
jgi:oligopeptide transport system substrate-binding protein